MRQRLPAVLVLWGLAPGCRGPADVTGVRVAATWAGFEPDQLSYALAAEDGTPLGEPERRPGRPEGPLVPGAAVVVYLPRERGGQPLRCEVEALAAGRLLARGSASATAVEHRIVDLTVALSERVSVPPLLEGVSGDAGTSPLPDADTTVSTFPDAFTVSPDVAIDHAPLSADAAPLDVRPDAPAVRPEPPPSDGPVTPPDLAVDVPPPLKERGQPCALAAECASGFCSGGVCCAEACTALCRSCAGAQPGTCLPTAVGSTCAPASCDDNTFKARTASTCDGQGTCTPGAVTSCAPYRCAGAVCSTRCSGPSSCVPGWTCLSRVCRMSAP